jgi:transposase-like protein
MSSHTNTDAAPWHDEQTLRRLYIDEDLERAAVAARLGCSKSTVDDWLTKHDIQKDTSKPYHDEATLRRLYVDDQLTDTEIAERFGCAQPTITNARRRLGIETREHSHYTHTTADLIEHLQRVNEACEYRVCMSDMDADSDAPNGSVYVDRFGGWHEALRAAEIDPDAPTQAHSSYRETLQTGQANFLGAHRDLALRLYRTDETFSIGECDLSEIDLRRLSEIGLIERTGAWATNSTGEHSWPVREWAIADGVTEWIGDRFDGAGDCPNADCEATGIKNLGDGEFTCSNEDCPETFGRETALEVVR